MCLTQPRTTRTILGFVTTTRSPVISQGRRPCGRCLYLDLSHQRRLSGCCSRSSSHLPRGAKNPGFRSAAMIRSLTSATENPSRARPNSNICGTSCAGALLAASIANHSPRIRTATRHNTTAIARWEWRPARRGTRIRSTPRLGRSSTASSISLICGKGWTPGARTPPNTSNKPTGTGRRSRI
jgi:hypothetical protein